MIHTILDIKTGEKIKMKLSRKQLRKLIEARIKPSLEIPGLDSSSQQKIRDLASSRSKDTMGRQYADRSFDSLIDPLTGDDVPFSQREFQYNYPMIEDPEFKRGIEDLFEIFMYENKGFSNDVYDLELEDYQDMVNEEFVDQLPSQIFRRKNIVTPAVAHTFSSGEIPYQIEEIIKRITSKIAKRVYEDQLLALPTFP